MQEIKLFTNTRLLAYQYGVLKALKKLKINPKHLISDEASFINIFLYTDYNLLKKYYEGIVLDKKKFISKHLNFKDYIFNDYYLEVELQGNLIYQSQITPKDFNRFLNYNFKKKYGQNFLNDSNLSDDILDVANIDEKTEVLEIGPGLGFLTEKLIENSKFLTAFEIDDDLIPFLNKKFQKKENFKLIHQDFMEVDLKEFFENEENKTKKNVKIVANIPYYITSPIINKLLEYRENIDEIYLMVQKEVAERIASQPHSKNMSLLTHAVQFYAETEYLFTVPKEKFDPVPKVDSVFLGIKILKDKRYESQISEEKYFKYLKEAFSNKRKSIANNLTKLGFSKDVVGNALEKIGKARLTRAEEFSVQEFIDFIGILES